MRSTSSRRKKSLKTEGFILSQPFNRLNDVYFKSVMASPERKHITIAFLNAVMSHDYAGHSRRGLHYKDFEPVVFVGLLNFCISEESESLHEWHNLHKVLNTATHDCEFDLMDIHFAELPLLRRKWRKLKHKPSTQFEELMFYFGNVGGKNMGDALVQEIAERNPVVADLLDYEREFRSDPLVMRQYIFAERAHYDYLANLELEREDERKNIIRTIRAKGVMTDEQIADMLNLPLDFVKNA